MTSSKPTPKRGRPKSAKTLNREKTEAWLKNSPPHITPMSTEEKQWWDEFIKNSEEAQRATLQGYSPLLPHSLIYDLESLGDESMHGFEQSILDKYEQYRKKEIAARANGAVETASQADTRARRLWNKNKTLAKRIEKGTISLNSASENIHRNWEIKGIEGKKPSIKTISNWYKRLRPN